MNLEFNVTNLKPNCQSLAINSELIRFIRLRRKAVGMSNVQLAKHIGYKNINKTLRRLHHFEKTGELPDSYWQKIGDTLDIDLTEIGPIQESFLNDKFSELDLFIKHFDQIWCHRKFIVRNPEYANIGFPGIYFSVAYLAAPSYNIGLVLQHYMNGHWLVDNVCCDRLYIIGAGGSPLSGNNTCHGFCRHCCQQKSFKLPSFGTLLKAHKELQPACEQRETSKTMVDLLIAFQ